jgi:hypothetical protein
MMNFGLEILKRRFSSREVYAGFEATNMPPAPMMAR